MANVSIVSLQFAKYTLASFLENEKRDQTLKTAKTGDDLYVVGVTRQKTLILAYNQKLKRNCYKAIYMRYLVVVGVAHDVLLGQNFFKHDSFLAYDGDNVFMIDKSANSTQVKKEFARKMQRHPLLKVKTYPKGCTVQRRYIQADYNSNQVGNFLDVEDPNLPNSSEAHTIPPQYPEVPRKTDMDNDDEDMDHDYCANRATVSKVMSKAVVKKARTKQVGFPGDFSCNNLSDLCAEFEITEDDHEPLFEICPFTPELTLWDLIQMYFMSEDQRVQLWCESRQLAHSIHNPSDDVDYERKQMLIRKEKKRKIKKTQPKMLLHLARLYPGDREEHHFRRTGIIPEVTRPPDYAPSYFEGYKAPRPKKARCIPKIVRYPIVTH